MPHATITTMPDRSLTLAERSENAADLHITIAEAAANTGADMHITLADAAANAAEATARQQQLAELEKTAYPLETEPAPLTLRQRWNAFWRRRRIAKVRADLAEREQHRDGLEARANRAKHAAQLAYGVHLQQIDSWRDSEAADAKADIKALKAELELLEATECA